MQLKLVKSFWGMDGTLRDKMERIAAANFVAVEGRPAGIGTAEEFLPLRREFKLEYIPMILTEGATLEDHLADFRVKVEEALRYEPMQITAHSGKDSWSFEQQKIFFAEALAIEQRIGLPINHETHRSRAMFTPWTTAALLREFPELSINADFSHWLNVCESRLEDQAENLALCISRTRHVHGRVGHEQGAQVNDPRAPEWADHVALHEAWWDEMVRVRQQAGAAYFTFNPEFGPPNYMPTLPHSQQPVADLWEICVWMAERFTRRFSRGREVA
jgi:hypothetical protein